MTTQTPPDYVIISISSFYGIGERRTLVRDQDNCTRRFATRKEAYDYIRSLPRTVLAHNQYAQSEQVVRVDRLPRYLALDL